MANDQDIPGSGPAARSGWRMVAMFLLPFLALKFAVIAFFAA